MSIQRRAIEEGYDSQDTEAAMVFQKVSPNAPRDMGTQTLLRFNPMA